MPGIGIVTNPNSRRNRRNPGGMEQLAYILGDRGPFAKTQSIGDIDRVAADFKERGVEILGLNGGDGTNHVTLSAFIRVYGDTPLPKIAFLRGGTMNTVADACGIFGTPQTLLYNLIEKYHAGEEFHIIQRDILKIGDRYGFIFGNGLVYNFLEEYYRGAEASPWKAAKTLARVIASAFVRGPLVRRVLAPFEARVTTDGHTWEATRFLTVFGSTVEQIGLGFRPFIRSEERPRALHLLGITTEPLDLALSLWRIYFGKPLAPRQYTDAVASEVILESPEPIRYTIDGDLHVESGPLRITTGPRLDIIVH